MSSSTDYVHRKRIADCREDQGNSGSDGLAVSSDNGGTQPTAVEQEIYIFLIKFVFIQELRIYYTRTKKNERGETQKFFGILFEFEIKVRWKQCV